MKIALRHTLTALLLACGLSSAFAQSIDLNTATRAQLETLDGIGPKKADAILQYRQEKGPFKSVDDLKNVHGIGDKMLSKIKPKVTVGSAPMAAPPTAVPPPPVISPAKPAAPAVPK